MKSCELNTAITWNGLTYLIQKLFYTGIIILLSKTISPYEFKLWVTINSGVYLLLLWIDGGIRKSIPLYISSFISKPKKLYSFLFKLILCYSFIFLAILLLYYNFNYDGFSKFYLSLILASYLFLITQGLISILRPFFQALSLNKNFNLVLLTSLLLKYISIIFLVALKFNIIASSILAYNILANIIVLIVSFYLIKKIPKNFINTNLPKGSFAKHSFFMLIITILKSITNRNALTLLAANCLDNSNFITYKIAQSSATLFYRFKVRAMGYNGFSLLSKANSFEKNNTFNKILNKSLLLIIPLLIFTFLGFINFSIKIFTFNSGNFAFIKFFLLFTVFYIIYSLCICYEKLLEIEQSYKNIIKAYVPYLIGVILSAIIYIFNKNLFNSYFYIILVLIHFLKLNSSLYIVSKTKNKYNIKFPWSNLTKTIIISLIIAILLNTLLPELLMSKLIYIN